jgi:hypothetical protein
MRCLSRKINEYKQYNYQLANSSFSQVPYFFFASLSKENPKIKPIYLAANPQYLGQRATTLHIIETKENLTGFVSDNIHNVTILTKYYLKNNVDSNGRNHDEYFTNILTTIPTTIPEFKMIKFYLIKENSEQVYNANMASQSQRHYNYTYVIYIPMFELKINMIIDNVNKVYIENNIGYLFAEKIFLVGFDLYYDSSDPYIIQSPLLGIWDWRNLI